MQQCAAGDRAAFEQLFQRHKPDVAEFAEYLLRDREAAEDVAQEAFLRVLGARQTYRPTARFRTWVYTIVRNLCYDELRKHRRQVSLESVLGRPPTAEDTIPGADTSFRRRSVPGPDAQAEARELADLLAEILPLLSEDHREVVVLRMYEGLGCAEAASRLGCSPGTIKSRLHYAMKRLRDELMGRM